MSVNPRKKKQIWNASNERMVCRGTTTFEVSYHGQSTRVSALVSPDLNNDDVLLDWKTLQKDLEETDWDEVQFMLKKKKLGTVIPRDEDLHGAAQALIRLQDVYELDIRDLSKGARRFPI